MKTIYILIATMAFCSCHQSNSQAKKQKSDPLQTAQAGMKAFFGDYSKEDVIKYFDKNYIQHNPHVPTGREPLIGFLPALKEAGTTFKNHRTIVDGDFVVMHNSYDNAQAFGAKEIVTFDVFRVKKGKVAEHWDAITPLVKETASGRTQTDGPTAVNDLDKTDENKALVKAFVDDILFGNNPEKITEYVSTETYNQHNVFVEDGLEGLNKAIQYLISQNDMFVYTKTHKVLGQGNFVLTMSEGTWHGKAQSFYDLFRVENGKIVEHWDVIQDIPEQMAHTNGMF